MSPRPSWASPAGFASERAGRTRRERHLIHFELVTRRRGAQTRRSGLAAGRCIATAITLAFACTLGSLALTGRAQATTVENPEDPADITDPAPPPDAPPQTEPPQRRGPPLGLNFRVRGGATYQFKTKLKEGGSFDTSRTVLDVGARYGFTENLSTVLSVSYGYDPYGFSDEVRIGGIAPWEQLHALRVSAPVFWRPTERLQLLAVPIFRMQAEAPSAWGDSMSGGGIIAFSWKFSDTLRVGPGFGGLSELERRPTLFPVILIDWQVSDRFAITTGRGLGASTGPGLQGVYTIRKFLDLTLGFRFERARFRLEPRPGQTVGGIGEDESFPVFATLRWGPQYAFLALLTGAEFRGRLRIEDPNGKRLAESAYKPSAFIGFAGQIFF